jgi:hypothetical protein
MSHAHESRMREEATSGGRAPHGLAKMIVIGSIL